MFLVKRCLCATLSIVYIVHVMTFFISGIFKMLMDREKSSLLVVDIQERLLPAMADPSCVVVNSSKLVEIAKKLHVPIAISEQYPKGLGHTDASLDIDIQEVDVFEKIEFSCYKNVDIRNALQVNDNRRQLVICGIESHVCVLQTAVEFSENGFDVFVVADAISSRNTEHVQYAIDRMKQYGIHIVTVEMVLFEWLGQADHDEFRHLTALIK